MAKKLRFSRCFFSLQIGYNHAGDFYVSKNMNDGISNPEKFRST
jgi:hypothetical protein